MFRLRGPFHQLLIERRAIEKFIFRIIAPAAMLYGHQNLQAVIYHLLLLICSNLWLTTELYNFYSCHSRFLSDIHKKGNF